MLKLHDYLPSGNGYKIRLLLAHLDVPYELKEYNILKGETHTPEFLKLNPNGRIPVLELEDGRCVAESGAALYFLSNGTDYLPEEPFERAQVLQWMFFEQYSHEPNIATARYILDYLPKDNPRHETLPEKRKGGYAALDVMEQRLTDHLWLATDTFTIADIALYAYTHVADEGGFDLSGYANINAWLDRIKTLPGHIRITDR